MTETRHPIVVVGVSHQTAGLAARERVALDDARARAVLGDLGAEPGIHEAVVLSTCNRTEIYAVAESADDGETTLRRALLERTALGAATLNCSAYTLFERDAVEHLIRVTAGLESAILGETEIGGQVRAAASRAEDEGAIGEVLAGVFQRSLAAARRVRRRTGISAGATSVASAVVDLIERSLPPVAGQAILLVGAGRLARSLAGPLAAIGGAELAVVNRTPAAARDIAERHGARAASLEELDRELAVAGVVVCATDAPQPVVTAAALDRALAGRPRPLVVIDLALPRDVEPSASALAGLTLHDLDAVHELVGRNLAVRRREARAAAEMVRLEADRLLAWRRELDVAPMLRAVWEQAEQLRRHELERAAATLSDEERQRLERFSASLVRKLLHVPSERLRAASQTQDAASHLESVRLLFDIGGGARDQRSSNVIAMPQRGAA